MKSILRAGSVAALGAALVAVIVYGSTSTILGVASMPHSELVSGPATLTMRQFTSFPGEVGNWHSHPGSVFNVVNSGAVTVEDGCGEEITYTAGQAFEKIGGRVHRWKNLGSEPSVEYNLFVNPQGAPLAVNLAERRCGPPLNVDECRREGWRAFDYPAPFANQGECISSVRHNR